MARTAIRVLRLHPTHNIEGGVNGGASAVIVTEACSASELNQVVR